jgi:hypothetical protein
MHEKKPFGHAHSVSEAVATIKDWVTVDTFCTQFTNIPKKTIRWQLTLRHSNGLEPYVQVIGKQRYISIRGYAEWLKHQSRGPGIPAGQSREVNNA